MLDILEEKLEKLNQLKEQTSLTVEEKLDIDRQVEEYRKELLAEKEAELARKKADVDAQISLLKELIVEAKEADEPANEPKVDEVPAEPNLI